jgi:hypothetical protein
VCDGLGDNNKVKIGEVAAFNELVPASSWWVETVPRIHGGTCETAHLSVMCRSCRVASPYRSTGSRFQMFPMRDRSSRLSWQGTGLFVAQALGDPIQQKWSGAYIRVSYYLVLYRPVAIMYLLGRLVGGRVLSHPSIHVRLTVLSCLRVL